MGSGGRANCSPQTQVGEFALLVPLLVNFAILLQPWIVLSQPSEQLLLYDFYNATSGWASGCSRGWITNTTPLCSGGSSNWAKVTCSAGRVAKIDLANCGIRGTLPTRWSSLTNVQHVDLQYNSLSGTLPPQWSNMTSMQYVDLQYNSLSGTLPPQWSYLTSMQYVDLQYNSLSGTLPLQWSSLTSMQTLSLYSNSLNGTLPPQWSSLANVQHVDLQYNSLSGTLPPQWSYLTSILFLRLDSNYLNGTLPWQWSSLTNMQTLSLNNNAISGTLPPEWSSLTNMQTLFLDNNAISGTLPPQWSSLANMQTLYLDNNAISGTLPPEWSSLTNMQTLYLYTNSLRGTLPPQWSNLTNIHTFYFDSNYLSGTLPPQWSSLTNMRTLNLYSNSLSGTLPPQWSSLTKMQTLLLFSNSLRGTLPTQWSALFSLLFCYVNDNCLDISNASAWWLAQTISPQRSDCHLHARSTSVSFSTSVTSQHTGSIRATGSGSSTRVIGQPVLYVASRIAAAARTVAVAAAVAPMLAGAGIASMGCSAVQLSVVSSLLASRRREPSSTDGIGASLLENPLELKLSSLPLSLQMTGGAVVGNAVVCAIVVVCRALMSHVFEGERRHLCDAMSVWQALRTYIMERLPGALLPPVGLLLQPTLASSLSLIISPHRTAGTCVLGALASVIIVGGLAWTTFTVRVGVLNRRVLCASNIVALLPTGVEGCCHAVPRVHWAPLSTSHADRVFFLRFGPFFINSMNDCSMYFAFDLWSTVAVALLTAIGLSLDDAAVALPASGVLCGIALVRLLVVVGLRPFSVALSNVIATLLEALSVAAMVLGCVAEGSGDEGEEAIVWLSVVQTSLIGLSGLADCAMRVGAVCHSYFTAAEERKLGRRPLKSGVCHEADGVLRELVTHICAHQIVRNHKT